jgi:hypothetical protein
MKFPKFRYIRSKTHLKAVANLNCQLCGSETFVQASHSNQSKHGKGRGIKASDEYTAALCLSCHYDIDQGTHLNKYERVEKWDKAHKRTFERMQALGTWDNSVPVPEFGKGESYASD